MFQLPPDPRSYKRGVWGDHQNHLLHSGGSIVTHNLSPSERLSHVHKYINITGSQHQQMLALLAPFVCSIVSDSLQCHGLYSAWLLCPWNSPGKNTRVGSHSLLRGIFLTQGSNLGIPTLQADSLLSEPPGKLTLLPRLYQQN